MKAQCSGICLLGFDIGVPSSAVAYAHPNCPEHGDDPHHAFELAETDGYGKEYCRCGGVRSLHDGEPYCPHDLFVDGACYQCGQR